MSGCFYHLPEWFDLLWAHGFPRASDERLDWALCASAGVRASLPVVLQGGTLQSLSSYYTPRFGPCEGADPDAVTIDAQFSASWLKGRTEVHSVRLQPFRASDRWVSDVERALRLAGFACWHFECGVNWLEPVPQAGGFDAYWAARPSRLRNTVQRARRKLARSSTSIDIVAEPGPVLTEAIEAYQAVYADSWKGAEPCPQFMPGLLRLAAAQGVLRLGLLRLEGKVVAAQVWLVHDGQADIYKLAQRPGYEALSVGSVLLAAMMAHVIDVDRVSTVDFLMGDDTYKKDWMTVRRPLWGLVAFRWRDPGCWPALLRHVGGVCLGWVRRRVSWGVASLVRTTTPSSGG